MRLISAVCVFVWILFVSNCVAGSDDCGNAEGSGCILSRSAAVTVDDCGDPVAEGDPQVLTCNITGSIVYGIRWFREGDTKSIITCSNTSKICISNNETLYSVNSTPHPDNKQQFTIKSVSAEDFTKKWICIDGDTYPDTTTTGSLLKSVDACGNDEGSGCILSRSATVTADCGDPVTEGDPIVLTCHITGSIGGINWFREGDPNRIIICDGTSNICTTNYPILYSVNSTPHPDNKQQFTINSVSAEDFTKKWICIDGDANPKPITASSACTLSESPPVAATASTLPTISTAITQNTTQTTWIVVGSIMGFILGLCCGILGVLLYLKRLNINCLQTKKNSEAGDVNNYEDFNMTESTDNPTSSVYINLTTNPDHPPASSSDYIQLTADSGGSNPDHPSASSSDYINQGAVGGCSKPDNTYEQLATAYTNENSYETLQALNI